jgi:hypothetical protein
VLHHCIPASVVDDSRQAWICLKCVHVSRCNLQVSGDVECLQHACSQYIGCAADLLIGSSSVVVYAVV